MPNSSTFPLSGVIGVVANSTSEIALATEKGLQCVEIRADLLLDAGLSTQALLDIVKHAKAVGLAVLFTLRHPTHGGTYDGEEAQRVSLSFQALEAGADLFDLEFGSEAAAIVLSESPENLSRMILSYHNFNAMPDSQELQELTAQMESIGALAVKVVPTASRLEHALTMLQWVGQGNGSISRIGFAMGEHGASSRILTTAHGGEITYASFGAPVAPGQVDIDELVFLYGVGALDVQSQITAVCVEGEAGHQRVVALNKSFAGSNRVAVRFPVAGQANIDNASDWLRVSGIVLE